MCTTCGCDYHSNMDHEEMHKHGIAHEHHHETGYTRQKIEQDVLSKNSLIAERNRGYFEAKNITCYNIVSSPGSGKTSFLEKTIELLNNKYTVFVIEGDQQTSNDTNRIKALNVPCLQINTENGCHLDANMIYESVKSLAPENNSILFIENVGNLVCPALFDLGEQKRIVLISVTEGDDKPLKYPYMFESADICIINKIDLLPYIDSKIERIKDNARIVNPDMLFFEISATKGSGMDKWIKLLDKLKSE